MKLEKLEEMDVQQLRSAYAIAANSPEEKHQLIANDIYAEYIKRMEPIQGKCIVSILRASN